LGKISGPVESKSRKKLVCCALACAKTAWKYVRQKDKPVIKKLYRTVENYVKGKASLDDVRSSAASASAAAAASAYASAAYAADAAASAAYAAAYAAANAACADANAACADDAAKKTAQITMCKIIRKAYPKFPRLPKTIK